jgi:hypothetical protein
VRPRAIACATLLVVVTSGCAATSGGQRRGWSISPWRQDSTAAATAEPEVVIPEAGRNRVVDVLVDRMTQQGYRVSGVDDFHLQFERPASLTDRFLGYSSFRVTFMLLDTSVGLRVRTEMASIRTLEDGYEETVTMKGGRNAAEIQRTLDTVKQTIEAGSQSPPTPRPN